MASTKHHHAKKHAKKKHPKHGGKLHGAALTAWKKAHGMGPHHAHHGGTHHKAPRAAAHKAHKVHHHKCPYCGHAARHDSSAGCLHRDAKGRFCDCHHGGR